MRKFIAISLGVATVFVVAVIAIMAVEIFYSNAELEKISASFAACEAEVVTLQTALARSEAMAVELRAEHDALLAKQVATGRLAVAIASRSDEKGVFEFSRALVQGDIPLNFDATTGTISGYIPGSSFHYTHRKGGYNFGWSGEPPWTAYARASKN